MATSFKPNKVNDGRDKDTRNVSNRESDKKGCSPTIEGNTANTQKDKFGGPGEKHRERIDIGSGGVLKN